jgi:hypothetical protein
VGSSRHDGRVDPRHFSVDPCLHLRLVPDWGRPQQYGSLTCCHDLLRCNIRVSPSPSVVDCALTSSLQIHPGGLRRACARDRMWDRICTQSSSRDCRSHPHWSPPHHRRLPPVVRFGGVLLRHCCLHVVITVRDEGHEEGCSDGPLALCTRYCPVICLELQTKVLIHAIPIRTT